LANKVIITRRLVFNPSKYSTNCCINFSV